MDRYMLKLEVDNISKAMIWLVFQEIEHIIELDGIYVNKDDWDYANNALVSPSPNPPPKKRAPDTYKGGRPTLESQGGHTKEKISITISNEADAHLRDCQKGIENKSQVVDRVILEHKTMIDIAEETE